MALKIVRIDSINTLLRPTRGQARLGFSKGFGLIFGPREVIGFRLGACSLGIRYYGVQLYLHLRKSILGSLGRFNQYFENTSG